jgi:hypothetical protein
LRIDLALRSPEYSSGCARGLRALTDWAQASRRFAAAGFRVTRRYAMSYTDDTAGGTAGTFHTDIQQPFDIKVGRY